MNNKFKFASLFKYLKKDLHLLILSLFSALIYAVSITAIPFLVGLSVNYMVEGNTDFKSISIIVLIMGILTVSSVIFDYIYEFTVGVFSYNAVNRIRKDLYSKYLSVPISYLDSSSQGDLIQKNILDCEYITNGLISFVKQLYLGIVTVIVTIVFMFILNYILALAVCLLTPLSFVVTKFVSKTTSKYFKKQSAAMADQNGFSNEMINNLSIIQSFNFEEESNNIYTEKNGTLYKYGQKALFSSSWPNPTTRVVNNIIYCVVAMIAILLFVFADSVPAAIPAVKIGIIGSFLSYTNQYTKPFNDISSVLSEFGLMKASYNRVHELLTKEDDIDVGQNEIVKPVEAIDFKNMNFSYDPSRKLIQDFNLHISKGQRIALVGKTGCGKTTLINVLMRFYDYQTGEIDIDGIKTLDIKKSSLRNKFAMVLQDSWLFNGTIYDNIRYSKPDATKEEIIEASKKANAHSFIMRLPNGYDTVVSNKSGLSEGEKQLLTIARCMLKMPEILILDEATSSIDTRSERKIYSAFDKFLENRTSIVIAHRLQTIVNSDLILMMENGIIVEKGTHEELIAKHGKYFELYNSQFEH